MARHVAVVPHSHWDREWYAPFEAYRLRLLAMVDGLLELLESGLLPHFHLDGQVAAIDDYLEARPEAAERVAALVASGRLAIGPWFVLMDEFCVSAESIVRNLELGLQRASALGANSFSGYLPDMFGHVAQMPQVLAQAGLAHAVVWRGVPSKVDSTAFWWEAPDGSRVAAEYLPVGYASGAFLPKEPDALLRRLLAHEHEIERFLGPDRPLLLMNGGDHQDPQAWVPGLLEEANRAQDHFTFSLTSLHRYLDERPPPAVSWTGELRSGVRAPILMGVLSNRVDVKQAAARAEAAIEKVAEPLATLWLPPPMWPGDRLERAWRQMILNSAHDSICACSADPVGRAVLARYDTVDALASSVIADALGIAGVAPRSDGVVVVNPSPAPRSGLIEIDLAGGEEVAGTQQLSVTGGGVVERTGVGADMASILGSLADSGLLGAAGRPEAAEVSAPGEPLVVTLHSDATRKPDPLTAPVMAEAWARAGAGRDEALTVRVVTAPTQRVLAYAPDVPGWGWSVWSPRPPDSAVTATRDDAGWVLANGHVTATIGADGLVALDGGPSGLNRIVSEGDAGDTYNFSPGPTDPVVEPVSVEVSVVETGPLRATVRACRRYRWAPDTDVYSDVTLAAGSTVLQFRTWFDHSSRDHRVRAIFPLPTVAAASLAECAFGAVTRGEAEGGPSEPALATYPSRRFVSAGGLTVFHSGLLEYELVDDGKALALTLLRAVGILSRPAPPARPNVAGPATELLDTQLPGRRSFSYAVGTGIDSPWPLADSLAAPLAAVRAAGGGPLGERGQRLAVELGANQVSALRRVGDQIELRVFNPSDQPASTRIPGRSGSLVDLTGRPVGVWADAVELAPQRFATLRIDQADLDA